MIVSNRQYAALAKMTAAEQETAERQLWQDKTAGKSTSAADKKLIILVGQPGSGKSTLAAKYLSKNPNLISISGDDVLAYHPRLFQLAKIRPPRLNSKARDCYDNPVFRSPQDDPLDYNAGERYIEEFSYDTFIKTTSRLFEKGHSVLLDILPGDEALAFASLGKRLGYNVRFVAAVVPKQISEQNIISRFEGGQARFQQALNGELPKTAQNVPHTYNRLRQAPEDLGYAQQFLHKVVKSGYSLQVVNPVNRRVLGKDKAGISAYMSEIRRPLEPQEQALIKSRNTALAKRQAARGASAYENYVRRCAAR